MSQQGAALPVFVDATGRRARVVQWLARGVCAAVAVVAAAVGVTLLTTVPLPGLGGLLAPGDSARPPTSGASAPQQSDTSTEDTRAATRTVLGTTAEGASRPATRTGHVRAHSRPRAGSATAGSPPSTGVTGTSPTPGTP